MIKSFFKVGEMSSLDIVRSMLKLSVVAFVVYILYTLFKLNEYNLLVIDDRGMIKSNTLQQVIANIFYKVRTFGLPILALLYTKLLCEVLYKALKLADKHLEN